MNQINATLIAFEKKETSNPDFIAEMYFKHHTKLFEYSKHLDKTNIKKIEIENRRVLFTSKDRGVRMYGVPGDFRITPIEILNFLDYEKDHSEMLQSLVSDGDVVLDIGTNIGWYSINLTLTHRSAKIHAFEPIPNTYQWLEKNVDVNGVINVALHNFGLSNKAGTFDFYSYPEGSGNASTENLSERSDATISKCKLKTLDEFTSEFHELIDFIKCDVEGGELLVFQGGKETIKNDLPIVFSEILRKWSAKFNYNLNEIFRFFEVLKYQAFTVKMAS
jgi:FkbM family methyltransferase